MRPYRLNTGKLNVMHFDFILIVSPTMGFMGL